MNKNSKLLADFTKFCEEHPDLRFWQALNAWAELPNLVVVDVNGKIVKDTFYWENRDN